MYDNNIKNVVFVTTDAHFPIMLKYNANVNRDGDPVNIYEIVWWSQSAIPYGIPGSSLLRLDPTFEPTILRVEGGIFNFGYFKIQKVTDGLVHLTASIIGQDDVIRPNSFLDLAPHWENSGEY